MTKKAAALFIIFCFANLHSVFSQENIETSQHFGQFYNNPILNIARNGLDSKVELNMGNQRNVGIATGVSTSYLGLYINQKSKKRARRKSKNVYGIYFYNDQEGEYFFRRRALFSFARHQQLSKEWNLSLAISGGIYLTGIKPTQTTPAYSDNSFEGNSSLLLYSKEFQFGLSMNQLTNSSVQPAQQVTRLRRHYYFYSQYKWKTNNINFIPSVFVKYMNINNPLSYTRGTSAGVSLRAVYNIVMAGAIVDNDGVYITIGLSDWELYNTKYNLGLSYFVPTLSTNINVNRMELNLRMKFNGRKEVTFFN